MTFHGDLALTRTAEGDFGITLEPRWGSLVGIHGGFSAAATAAAMATVAGEAAPGDDRPLRSLTTQFVSAPRPGPARIEVTLERGGRTASYVTSRLAQDGRLRLLSTAVVAADRTGPEFDDRPRPAGFAPVPPAGLGQIAPPPGLEGHFPNAHLVLDPATTPFTGQSEGRLAGWLRPLHGEAVSLLWLACIADFFPPAVFARLTAPVAAASIDYNVHFVEPDPATHVGAGQWVYAELATRNSAHGYASEAGAIWAPDGTTLAVTHQLRLAG